MDKRFGSPIRGWSYAFKYNKYCNHYCFSMAVLFGCVMLKVSLSAIFMLTVLNCNITKHQLSANDCQNCVF